MSTRKAPDLRIVRTAIDIRAAEYQFKAQLRRAERMKHRAFIRKMEQQRQRGQKGSTDE